MPIDLASCFIVLNACLTHWWLALLRAATCWRTTRSRRRRDRQQAARTRGKEASERPNLEHAMHEILRRRIRFLWVWVFNAARKGARVGYPPAFSVIAGWKASWGGGVDYSNQFDRLIDAGISDPYRDGPGSIECFDLGRPRMRCGRPGCGSAIPNKRRGRHRQLQLSEIADFLICEAAKTACRNAARNILVLVMSTKLF